MKEANEGQSILLKRRGNRTAVLVVSLAAAVFVTLLACQPGLRTKLFSPVAAFSLDKPAEATGISAVTTANLNIRSGEGISYPVICTLEKGTSVQVLTKFTADGDWAKISTDSGETGWCSKKYLNVGGISAASAASSETSSTSPVSSAPASSASSQVSLATAAAQVSLEQSKAPLSISVSITSQRVTVYDKEKRIVKQFVCSTGEKGSETPTGTFRIAERGKSFYSKRVGEGGYYWTQFKGDYLFHSVPFDENYQMEPAEAAKLGTPASHGCVRLQVEDAKWIYDHVSRGTVVTIR